jgi:1,4-dihydroxy-2-naphthoate octaprenyltransferase
MASAWWAGEFSWVLSALALVVALSVQVGVNYANDSSDGIRGTDDYRVGPARLTGSGAVEPRLVLSAALLSFALTATAGLAIVLLTGQWWLLAVGAVALFAAWFYTGGKKPYGYQGLGEIVVFVFFGPVAVVGTAFIQLGSIPWETWLTGLAAGLFASAVLLVNNLRDIDQDQQAGKKTLAVALGRASTRVVLTMMLLGPYVILAFLSSLFLLAPYVYFTLLLTIPIIVIVWSSKTPKELILALQLMTLTALIFAIGLGLAIAL